MAKETFTSKWGIILTAIGMAVGTGNIWRFPRVAAENGGGAFLIPWVLFLFAWAIPLLLAEFALGKTTRKGPAGAVGALCGGAGNWLGVFVGLVTCFITFYYSVVTGWCMRYFVASLGTVFTASSAEAYWERFTNDPFEPVIFHAIALIVCCFIIYRGVVQGIERTNRIPHSGVVRAPDRRGHPRDDASRRGQRAGVSVHTRLVAPCGLPRVAGRLDSVRVEHRSGLGTHHDLRRLPAEERHVHAHDLHHRLRQQLRLAARGDRGDVHGVRRTP